MQNLREGLNTTAPSENAMNRLKLREAEREIWLDELSKSNRQRHQQIRVEERERRE